VSDERVWLRHPETGGAFHCPSAAVDDWAGMGWVPGDPPQEVNPALVDRLALERELAERSAEREAAEKQAAKTAKPRAAKSAESEEN
jgi:hypothetical protein